MRDATVPWHIDILARRSVRLVLWLMINLRHAMANDAAAMATIHIDAWRTAYRGLVPDSFLSALDRGKREARFRAFLASGAGETYIIERNEQAVGHLTIGPCRDNDLEGQSAGEIWGIYLAPAYWRRGIGTGVCRRAEEMLRERGFRSIVLWVFEGNDSARRFYEAMGYAPDGATKIIEVDASLTAIRYRKELPGDVSQAEATHRHEADETVT